MKDRSRAGGLADGGASHFSEVLMLRRVWSDLSHLFVRGEKFEKGVNLVGPGGLLQGETV